MTEHQALAALAVADSELTSAKIRLKYAPSKARRATAESDIRRWSSRVDQLFNLLAPEE